jgi:hypothetical protein
MSDAWELANGLNPNSAADGLVDSDGDGFTNAQEYRLGTDPRNTASLLAAKLAVSSPGSLLLQFTAQPGRSYTVEASTNPASGWQVFAGIEPLATQSVLLLPVNARAAASFFRIRVEN